MHAFTDKRTAAGGEERLISPNGVREKILGFLQVSVRRLPIIHTRRSQNVALENPAAQHLDDPTVDTMTLTVIGRGEPVPVQRKVFATASKPEHGTDLAPTSSDQPSAAEGGEIRPTERGLPPANHQGDTPRVSPYHFRLNRLGRLPDHLMPFPRLERQANSMT